MNNWIHLSIVWLAVAAGCAAAEPRPNIVVILADDLGYSDLGCYGSRIRTPNVDALAENGLRFTQFYNTGRCWPTRTSLMTGYYYEQVLNQAKGRFLPLPHYLAPLGYRNYHCGKWHLKEVGLAVRDVPDRILPEERF
jgi:arylsulfatase